MWISNLKFCCCCNCMMFLVIIFIKLVMALGLQFMHLIRISIMPIIYYKIMQVQSSTPHDHEEGQGESGGH